MARFFTLFSSSKGNSTYIGTANEGILIDAGKNAKQMEISLKHMQVLPQNIKAIFITHEHTDHIAGLRVFASRYNIDVYASYGTLTALDNGGHLNNCFNSYIIGEACVEAGGMCVSAFRTSHDSKESLGFSVETPDNRKISVATDTGLITKELEDALTGSDLVLLESNFDPFMLKNSDYPEYLKNRIQSKFGHLSNEDCADTIKRLVSSGTSRIVLGHLSENNNEPNLAFSATHKALTEIGAKEGSDYLLSVAPPSVMKKMIVF